MPTVESLSWPPVLPEASTVTQSLGSVGPLAGLEGRLMGLGSGMSKLWLVLSTVSLLLVFLAVLHCQTQAGQVECCTHCWCWLPQSWCGSSCQVDYWVYCQGNSPLLVFRIDGKCKEWEPNWGAGRGNVWHGERWRRQSASSTCWAACGCQGLRALHFWSGVCWGTGPASLPSWPTDPPASWPSWPTGPPILGPALPIQGAAPT